MRSGPRAPRSDGRYNPRPPRLPSAVPSLPQGAPGKPGRIDPLGALSSGRPGLRSGLAGTTCFEQDGSLIRYPPTVETSDERVQGKGESSGPIEILVLGSRLLVSNLGTRLLGRNTMGPFPIAPDGLPKTAPSP
jgi:hypothetical protein